jgi:hypothetical protein
LVWPGGRPPTGWYFRVTPGPKYLSIDYQAERIIEYLLGLSPQEALRKAGFLSGRFWLFRGALPLRQ